MDPERRDRAAAVGRVKTLLEGRTPSRPDTQPFADELLARLARAGRFRDEETAEHVERMSRSCALIARGLGWDGDACGALRAASALHDIGKVGVPDEVLRKPEPLSAEERALIETHAQIGHEILAGSGDEMLEMAATIALTHHERFDGTGYPRGLRGADIPLVGRIAAVADTFDALTRDRPDRPALDVSAGLDVVREGRGTHFDPVVLDAFETVLPEIEQVRLLYPDPEAGMEDASALFPDTEAPIRVLLVEDHAAVARGLELLLRREGIEVAGTARSLVEAEHMLDRRAPDVTVLDIALQEEDGLRLVPAAKERGTRVLLYTGATDAPTLAAARAAGADGVAAKAGSPAEFIAAVRTVAGGDSYLDPALPTGDGKSEDDHARLTPREREIVGLVAQGLSGEEIAAQLFLSPATVRTHLRNAMDRTGARTRSHLVAIAAATDQISIT